MWGGLCGVGSSCGIIVIRGIFRIFVDLSVCRIG